MKAIDYFLGAGPHAATRVEQTDGTVEIHMFNGMIVGYGNTAAEAAVHLGDQLRTLARFVECHEGLTRQQEPR
jgi:hypothetical protein